jgi:phage terminase large subunit GpA-like protein
VAIGIVSLTEIETGRLQPPERPAIVEWAEANWVLPSKVASYSGPWRRDFTPYLVPIMEAVEDSRVRYIGILKGNQVAGTELVNIIIGFWIDQNPEPTMVIMPTEDLIKDRLNFRLKPTFAASPCMMQHLGGDLDRFNIGKATEFDTMNLYIAWANSASTLEDKPVCNIVCDEIALFPSQAGRTTDPRRLAAMRQTTYSWKSKLIVLGKPFFEGDPADKAFRDGDQRDYWVPCVFCGRWHIIDRIHIDIATRRDVASKVTPFYPARDYERLDGPAIYYRCPHCTHAWTEANRWAACKRGRFLPAGIEVDEHGALTGDADLAPSVSFRIKALMAYPGFISVRQLGAEWVAAQEDKRGGDIEALKNYLQARDAIPWKETAKATPIDRLKGHLDPVYRLGYAPEGVMVLTAGFDVQIDHVWLVVYGWGYLYEGWLLWAGRLETGDTRHVGNYAPLTEALRAGIPTSADPSRRLPIAMAAGDSAFHRDAVLEYVRLQQDQRGPVVAARGSDHVTSGFYRAFKAPLRGRASARQKQKHDPRHVVRYDLNVGAYKDYLFRALFENDQAGPGYLHLPRDISENICLQLSSEEKHRVRRHGRDHYIWALKRGRENHVWDGSVYARFAADIADVYWLLAPGQGRRPLREDGRPVGRRPIRTRY